MSPFVGSNPLSYGFRHNNNNMDSNSNIVTIDVGGHLFQTTKQTLNQAGSKSLFSTISSNLDNDSVPFIDRDPEIFSVLLSLLRTGNLPSKAKNFDIQDLIFEAKFYGVEQLILNSQSNPSQFEPFDLEKSLLLPLTGRDSPTAISTTENGSVQVAHGCKITSFDWSLKRKSTILTQFPAIDSMLCLNSRTVAVGATDFSGLQILDLVKGSVKKNVNWENVTKSGSTVQAIGTSSEFLFTSFESSRRNSNCIMVYDVNDDFKPVTKIGHYEIFGAELDSAIPATKLRWLPSHNLLMSAGSHSGPSGVLGNIKFWDLRSGNTVWEIKENVDCFSDITVSDSLSGIFKVGVHSGEVFLADLRNIGSENAWICLGDQRKVTNGKKEGIGCKIESYGNQVFCTKGGDVELWSEVLIDGSIKGRFGSEGRVFRKNYMGRAKDFCGNRITHFSFGGNRMFVTRKDQQFVEVWQSSVRGF
ncbi:BTB/POZ domain-containing protein At5g41330-like [Solanum tuberosum]|uniref:Potassium channel tetramerization domain-containing protein n=1 Tax=Solanum tuberosum TaxID=4113 RepID=M1A544_SOLTU|nr:PREDICTED: BTB/POZ domain-containing protein At5g41330-like [Solanum tuberosum]XP_015166343.1 PREDICTED: BTB/POZ domain-containing protein At5g41330-like [Solanum tuberosum]XP_015166344.1 PREDICTED: BTB/POZ domain-containing protein At5g41330-like [Solanum tuberosum]